MRIQLHSLLYVNLIFPASFFEKTVFFSMYIYNKFKIDILRKDSTIRLSFEMLSYIWYILNKKDCIIEHNENRLKLVENFVIFITKYI